MKSNDLYLKYLCSALLLSAALSAGGAFAAEPAAPESTTQPVVLALAGTGASDSAGQATIDKCAYQANDKRGVCRAAAQGIDSLRRYIFRTRIIHNFYIWDFVKQE